MKKINREHLFGVAPCLSALKVMRRKIYKAYVNEKFQDTLPARKDVLQVLNEMHLKNVKIVYKSKDMLNRISGNHLHQNVILSVSNLSFKPIDGNDFKMKPNKSLWLALDQIQDPMNLGAIIRTSAYFGIEKLIVSERNSCPLSPVVSKASSGAMEWSPVYSTPSMKNFLKRASTNGWTIYGTQCANDPGNDILDCRDLQTDGPSILLLGNEGRGIDDRLLQLCNHLVTIPPSSDLPDDSLDSLNVSVATGILLHSLTGQKKKFGDKG